MNKRGYLLVGAASCMVISRAFVHYSVIAATSMLLATALAAIYAYPNYLSWSKPIKVYWGSYIILFWTFMLYELLDVYFGWSNELLDWVTISILLLYLSVFLIWIAYKKIRFYIELKHYSQEEDEQ